MWVSSHYHDVVVAAKAVRPADQVKRRLALLCLALPLAGCSPILYAPNTVNVPMLARKGEGNVAVQRGSDLGDTVQVEAAYSPAQGVGVLMDVMHGTASEGGAGGSMTVVEAGVGRYRSSPSRLFWETYGIVAVGSLENHDEGRSTASMNPGSTRIIDTKFFRYGIQQSLVWRSRFLDFSVSSRFVGLHHYDIKGPLTVDSMNVQDYLKAHRDHFLIEPALTVRVGSGFFKVQLQKGRSYNITDSDFPQQNGFWSVGLVSNFGR